MADSATVDTNNTNNKSSIRMEQPFKVLIDIWGVITSWKFRDDLINYLNQNMSDFLERNWNNYELKEFISRLRETSVEDRQTNSDLPAIVATDETTDSETVKRAVKSVMDNLKWRKEHNLNNFDRDIQELHQSIWTEGYRTKKLSVHVFDDVMPAFQKWTAEELSIKVYTFASGSSERQRLFLSSTVAGDLNRYVMNGINSRHRYKEDPKRYRQIVSAVVERSANNILYLTDNPRKAKAAIKADLRAIVVLRPGNTEYSERTMKGVEAIHTLSELDFIVAS